MSATTSGIEETRNGAPTIWSRRGESRVEETTLIGDGLHVQRSRQGRPQGPHNQRTSTDRSADRRSRNPTHRRANLLRKMSLQRSLAFYNRLRSNFGGPASGFGYAFESDFNLRRQLRRDFYLPMLGNCLGFLNGSEEGAEERRLFSDRCHWTRAQLHFQQYLGLRHRHHHFSRSSSLKLDLSPLDLRLIYGTLYGLGLKEALRLAFNEVVHLH
ncbi:uncharacterized protein LOC108093532 [Drosophila ficusphila]|uniref:uncharacterized protein LOC108093532 n=1 Tax=Drosophila ficusphila TaxID=30025 RepID=UPI0007E70CA3|nr:uncharacterized protein LOC108093532 [Drosophila ficusphila]